MIRWGPQFHNKNGDKLSYDYAKRLVFRFIFDMVRFALFIKKQKKQRFFYDAILEIAP